MNVQANQYISLAALQAALAEVEENLQDPVTFEIMENPVTINQVNVYDAVTIEHLASNRDPLTNLPITHIQINYLVRKILEAWGNLIQQLNTLPRVELDPETQAVVNVQPAPLPPPAPVAPPANNQNVQAPPTRIYIRYDTGVKNQMFIRGDGNGLNWEHGAPLRNVGRDLWVWEVHGPLNPCRFKVLINDKHEEKKWCAERQINQFWGRDGDWFTPQFERWVKRWKHNS